MLLDMIPVYYQNFETLVSSYQFYVVYLLEINFETQKL